MLFSTITYTILVQRAVEPQTIIYLWTQNARNFLTWNKKKFLFDFHFKLEFVPIAISTLREGRNEKVMNIVLTWNWWKVIFANNSVCLDDMYLKLATKKPIKRWWYSTLLNDARLSVYKVPYQAKENQYINGMYRNYY